MGVMWAIEIFRITSLLQTEMYKTYNVIAYILYFQWDHTIFAVNSIKLSFMKHILSLGTVFVLRIINYIF